MPEVSLGGQLFAHELCVVDQNLASLTQRERGGVVLTESVGTIPERGRAVIGNVGDRRRVVAHSKAKGAPTLVRHFLNSDRKTVEIEIARAERTKGPVAAQLVGPHGKVWRRHAAGE